MHSWNLKRTLFKYSKWGYAYVNGLVVLAESLNSFRVEAIAIGGNVKPSDNLFFMKITLVGCVRVESKGIESLLSEGLCNFGGNHFG
jgi:hypothetical protein